MIVIIRTLLTYAFKLNICNNKIPNKNIFTHIISDYKILNKIRRNCGTDLFRSECNKTRGLIVTYFKYSYFIFYVRLTYNQVIWPEQDSVCMVRKKRLEKPYNKLKTLNHCCFDIAFGMDSFPCMPQEDLFNVFHLGVCWLFSLSSLL